MNGALDRLLLIAGCLLVMVTQGLETDTVCALLMMIVTASAGIYFTDKRITGAVDAFYLLLACFFPVFVLALPLLFYELCMLSQRERVKTVAVSPGAQPEKGRWTVSWMVWCLFVVAALRQLGQFCLLVLVIIVFMTAASGWLYLYNSRYTKTKRDLIRTMDNSEELNRTLEAKNRYLIEKQNTEIYLATLRERNRIAREIHDNVGHMLSRSILQTGAALAVNQDEKLEPVLAGLKDTLDAAMSSIRSSVHDLHEDSVDLVHAVEEILKSLSGYSVHYEYDLSPEVPQNIKYCIISIVKEAVSNIIKHSNADEVTLVLREHPAFYQILIRDNGQVKGFNKENSCGIGLVGMRERLAAFMGTLDIQTDNGFRIFIHIPKKEEGF